MRASQPSFTTPRLRRKVSDAAASYRSGLYVLLKDGYHPAGDDLVLKTALDLARNRFTRGCVLSNPRATREFLRLQIGSREHESFCCIFLDNHHRVLAYEEMFRGTIDGASVHPREVVKRTLALNAAAIVFAHNHPSGSASFSHADELITRRLQEAMSLIDVRVLDHLLVTNEVVESMAERGML